MQDQVGEEDCGSKAEVIQSWKMLFESAGFKRAADLMTDGVDSAAKYEQFIHALEDSRSIAPGMFGDYKLKNWLDVFVAHGAIPGQVLSRFPFCFIVFLLACIIAVKFCFVLFCFCCILLFC